MKVKVVPAIGPREPFEVDVSDTETAGSLKKSVCETKRIPENVARLTYMGRAVRDEQTMQELGVREGDKFILITRTTGG